jgi:hypothetical protein
MADETPKLPTAFETKLKRFVDNAIELDRLKPLYKAADALDEQLRAEINHDMHNMKLTGFKHELGSFSATFKGPYASIPKIKVNEEGDEEVDEESRARLEQWSREQIDDAGHALFDVLFYNAVRTPRLSALVKEAIENGTEIPPGVQYRTIDTVQWRRPQHLKKAK